MFSFIKFRYRLSSSIILRLLAQSRKIGDKHFIKIRVRAHLVYLSFQLLFFINSGFMLRDVSIIKKASIIMNIENENFTYPTDSINTIKGEESNWVSAKLFQYSPVQNSIFQRKNLVKSMDLIGYKRIFNNMDNFIPVKCPDFRRKKSGIDFELILEAGYFSPIKYFELTNPDFNQIERLRINNEETQEGINFGFYGKIIGRKVPITFQAGITRNYFTEKMDLSYSYIQRDTTQGIITITQNEVGDTISAIYGDIINLTEVTGSKVKHYRNQMIDLPITLGYAFNFNNFSIGFDAGVIINLGLKSNGSILSSEIEFEELTSESHFKLNVGISYLGSANIAYKLGSKSKLYLNTKLRIIPSFFNVEGSTLNQKYNFLGVNLAYAYII